MRSGNDEPGSEEIVMRRPASSSVTSKLVRTSLPRKLATWSYRDPTRIGGSVVHLALCMFSSHSGLCSASSMYSHTTPHDRSISSWTTTGFISHLLLDT